MAEVTRAAQPPAAKQTKPLDFDAFLSYTRRDRPVVSGIQQGLHHIGRRLGQLRALRVFRDDTDLTASPDLWGRITEALDRSRFLIVTLSPPAAASLWVNKEVSYWLERRGREQLMLVLTAGHLHWDQATARFDPQASDAAPPVLTERGSLPSEPLFIDVTDDAPWDYRAPTFRDKITALAAPIHGKPKDQLASDDLREQRRFRRLRTAAITGLIALTVVAVVAAGIAVAQRQEAIRRLHDATVARLDAEGASMLAGATPGGDERAVQELLAAHAIANRPDGVPILNAQIARFATQKILDASSSVHQLAYSPDGSRVATADDDGTVRQWDAATGKPMGSPLKGHADNVTAVEYAPDGQTIASTSFDGTMRLWNAGTGAALNPNPMRVGGLTAVAVSPDGRMVVTGGNDDTLRIWDPHSGQLRLAHQVFTDNRVAISDVAFDRTGNLVAVSGNSGTVIIYDTTTGTSHAPTITVPGLGPFPSTVWRVAFSPDGHTIALGSDDLELWNADTGTLIRAIRVGTARVTTVNALAFSPDGHRIATGRNDGALQLWDADSGAQIGPTLTGHTGMVTGVAFSPDGEQIATASQDATLRLWNATLGQPMRGPDPVLLHVAFSPDGHRLAASGDNAVQLWDIVAGQPRPSLTASGSGPKSFGFVDGGRIVIAAADGTVQVWDASTGQPVGQPVHIGIAQQIAQRGVHFAFRGDGREIASGTEYDGTAQLWDVATGRALGQPMTVAASDNAIYALAFSPDGHHLAAGYDDGVRLWNTDTGQPEGTVMADPRSLPIMGVAFSRDGTVVAAGREDGAVELRDTGTGRPTRNSPLVGHTSHAFGVAFGVGDQLASGGSDATLRLWDTSTGKPTAAPLTVSDSVTSVAVSPHGRLAAAASVDGTVRVSPAVADPSQLCAKLSTNMSHQQWRDWVSPSIGYITVCPGLAVAPD
ncbi:MAG: PQQ-binding-like beta-propeller repeat protein [Mycobacteriaceae bacterium]|nr:PQQ-binding-like beta-propeller repeat protein [Mycobacteriaceae bacterium]